ncbi:MAG: heme exporter protein CcmB [Magnetovibrio sp.]|nr:heme exporter protein CcmB [Magnetovibrio sp.]
MNRFINIIRHELKLILRQGMDCIMIVMFFIIVITLFPFGVGSEPKMLAKISAGVIWVAALLASTLSLDRIYHPDFEDGSLELLCIQPLAIELIVTAKVTTHWLSTGLPLILAAPCLVLLLDMDKDGFLVLILSLFIGTPTLSLIGSIGAALTLGARRSGVLLSLLILPLYIPILIFGISAIDAAIFDLTWRAPILMQSGLLIGTLPLSL